ncbi:cupin 1 [Echria macrotheca]|uniref:Cupin 1 n=1 Tax=Echria macrotheca TaxID=438768 RepID=A0AAJ0F789_9PEZI|nr:cupin 1 [Echria macrotheca]
MLLNAFTTSIAALAFASTAAAAPRNIPRDNADLVSKLRQADTAVDRYPLLPNNSDFVFDFTDHPLSMANAKAFPALVGSGVSIAYGTIEACGMASLHIHPRSSEIFVVTKGKLITEMIPEGGVLDSNTKKPRVIVTTLSANQTTIFPQGSFHTQMNPFCEPASAVAAFPSEDPGAALVVPQAFELTDEVVANSFGGALSAEDIKRVREAVPMGGTFDVAACRKKCGL